MMIASNKIGEWFWHGLYAPATGSLKPSGYISILFRCGVLFAVATQVLAAVAPSLTAAFNSGASGGLPADFALARFGAPLIVGWPLLSAFIRRRNDFRPDLLKQVQMWAMAFPLLMAALYCIPLAEAFGIHVPIDPSARSILRTLFFALLIGAALVPGVGAAPVKTRQAQADDRLQSASQTAAREALAAQIAPKPAGRHLPVAHADRHKPVAANFPTVIERGRRLPEQGRVKPGWFS